jgi:hypothetical protein
VKKTEVTKIIRKKNSKVDAAGGAAENQKKQQASIISMFDEHGNQFVPQYISESNDTHHIYNFLDSARMEKLRYDLEITEQDCDTLNRREKLLNFRITKFSAVNNLKTDMAPFTTLWSIAASFTKVYESKEIRYISNKNLIAWLFGSFSDLDSDSMDEMLQDWIKQLTRILKTNLATYE